ncbi:MAG: bifunctional folylpolyglutamate synthase/dihydrofolate synthase, partial [Muribaculaceae bacterium]|nr:bifunctional folylpolyglutamate synthase/dihydrofolate synthase [Muribaculaceae bacterium]
DYAVIEVGLGGRLDSTNIITPLLSVITNISFDHTAQLGDTLPAIASEKAGIIKPGVPCVVGESAGDVRAVFEEKARMSGSQLLLADDIRPAGNPLRREEAIEADTPFGRVEYGLTGYCQERNLQTIVTALVELRRLGVEIPDVAVSTGLRDVVSLTGLSGRWMRVGDNPAVVCDTGHNEGGWRYLSRQLDAHRGPLVVVLGFVNDKDISHILPMVPSRAEIIYTRASVPRALPEKELAALGLEAGRQGVTPPTVKAAIEEAPRKASELARHSGPEESPLIFVGGATFVVADLLAINH